MVLHVADKRGDADAARQEQRRCFGFHDKGVAERSPYIQNVSGNQLGHGRGNPATDLEKDDHISGRDPAD
jgi:hypothetical protein